MSVFACAIDRSGGRIPDAFRAAVQSSPLVRDGMLHWRNARGFAGATCITGGARPELVQLGSVIVIGSARLDNRGEIARAVAERADATSDLELAARFVVRDHGARARRLLGDFAFVVWNPDSRMLVAVRDALGVRKLFHCELRPGVLGFASHASVLAHDREYDEQYLVERICQCGSDAWRTAYAGVRAVQPAGLLRVGGGGATSSQFWAPTEVPCGPTLPERDCCVAFRELLIDAVRANLANAGTAWSHLSGGLDSSSVVSIAQWLVERGERREGLAGTITYTDSLGTIADERAFSDAVVRRYRLRNEHVPHQAELPDPASDPLWIDQPDMSLVMAARDRAAARAVRHAGGDTLLTGEGGDSLVAGTMFFFADWLVTGRARHALREMVHRSALGRVSFWRLAYENAVLPLLPAGLRRPLTRRRITSVPPWVSRSVRRRFALERRSAHEQLYGGRPGRKYEDALAQIIGAIPFSLPLGPDENVVEIRHPYLYRPLVELALQLPPELCVRPHSRKWILREAMRGILPEEVRTRVGKGALDGVHAWSFVHDRQRVDRLLRAPILADLGCVDPSALRRANDEMRTGAPGASVWRDLLIATLDVEQWLQLRSGRWAATDAQGTMHQTTARHALLTTTGQMSRSST